MKQFLLCDKPCFPSDDDLYVHSTGGGDILTFRDLQLVAEDEKSMPLVLQSSWLPSGLI